MVEGYHATTIVCAMRILSSGTFERSTSPLNWLGPGTYFWERDLQRAMEWGVKWYTGSNTAVVKVSIARGNCLDLTEFKWIKVLSDEYRDVLKEYRRRKQPLPGNSGSDRPLNALLIQKISARCGPFDSVRGAFADGEEIIPGSGICWGSHIQVAVLNPGIFCGRPELVVNGVL